jgi:NADPH:quinone reductase-like Zn-dependent oxidoreductase
VGHHAIQLCTLSGYRVFATASPAQHARLKGLGAAECFDYRQKDVVAAIRKAAGEEGIWAAYDTACSNGSTDMCVGEPDNVLMAGMFG